MLSSNYKAKQPKTPSLVQIVTRGGIFSGLSFQTTKENDIQKSNFLSSVPSISFSFDYSRVIFDYGQSKNENDKELIKSIFSDMAPGTNFTVSQGGFLIETSATAADLSGTYSLIRLVGNAVIARPVTLTSLNQRITIYENKYFTSIPQIGTSSVPKSSNLKYVITNSLLSEKTISFFKFGIYPNDLIKVTGSSFNDKIFKVVSLSKNSDGSETLIVDEELTNEVAFGNPILIELIQSGPFDLSIAEKAKDNNTGSCTLSFLTGSSFCYDNHNENQCAIRSAEKGASNYVWSYGAECNSSMNGTTVQSRTGTSTRKTSISRIISSAVRNSTNTGTTETTTEAV